MRLCERWAAFSAAGFGKVVLVLDASESAGPHRGGVLALAAAVLSELPAGIERVLYFLGNPAPRPVAELPARGAQWMTENQRRASLITPVFERLDPAEQASVLVIGSGRIFDLEDWRGTPLLERTVLVSVGEPLQCAEALAEEMTSPAPADVVRRVWDPVTRVEISGPGFMPSLWDNPGYKLVTSSGRVALLGERLEGYPVRLRFFEGETGRVQFAARHASGRQSGGELAPAEAAAAAPAASGCLPPEEAAVFQAAVVGKPFRCPCCGGQHPAEQLRCLPPGSILGELVYPSLQPHEGSGFLLLSIREGRVWFEAHACAVLRLGAARVALKQAARAELYRFDERSGAWQPSGERLGSYHPLSPGAWAVFV
jgi:hypothetical protein